MTDFDIDMLREERLPLPVQSEKDPLREAPSLLPTDPALVAAMEARSRSEPASSEERKPEPVQAVQQPEPLTVDKRTEAEESERRAVAEAKRAQESGAGAEARRTRERHLTLALAGLLQAPESVRLDLLIRGYEQASPGEVAAAADAIVALYLRADPDLRRRLRPELASGVRGDPASPLALALSARLGALVMPAAPPPTPQPPVPEP